MITTQSVRTVLREEGFSCPSCVDKVEKQIIRIPAVESVKGGTADGGDHELRGRIRAGIVITKVISRPRQVQVDA